jgi:hypothetical protein
MSFLICTYTNTYNSFIRKPGSTTVTLFFVCPGKGRGIDQTSPGFHARQYGIDELSVPHNIVILMVSLPRSGSTKHLGESWHHAINETDMFALNHVYHELKKEFTEVKIILDGRSLGSFRAAQRAGHPGVHQLHLIAPPSNLDKAIQSYTGSKTAIKWDSWLFPSDLDKQYNVIETLKSLKVATIVYASEADQYFGTHLVVNITLPLFQFCEILTWIKDFKECSSVTVVQVPGLLHHQIHGSNQVRRGIRDSLQLSSDTKMTLQHTRWSVKVWTNLNVLAIRLIIVFWSNR